MWKKWYQPKCKMIKINYKNMLKLNLKKLENLCSQNSSKCPEIKIQMQVNVLIQI